MAFASVSVDDLVAIRGIRVVDSANGLFVTMPQSHDKKTEEYHDVAFPLSGDLRKEISRAVLDKYESPEKTAERKSLADGLAAGAAKAAEQGAAPRSAAKSRGAGVLE
jgi:stage V sporulation protein G